MDGYVGELGGSDFEEFGKYQDRVYIVTQMPGMDKQVKSSRLETTPLVISKTSSLGEALAEVDADSWSRWAPTS